MTFKDAYDQLPSQGWLTELEAKLLWDAAQETEGPILEVGSYLGRSTCLLAALGRSVYAVDPFEDGFDSDLSGETLYQRFLQNLFDQGCYNVQLFRQRIADWPLREVGFAYLDGEHTYLGTQEQINAAVGCRAKVIAIHDVNDSGGGLEVKRAAVEQLGQWDERVERLAVWRLR